MTVKGPFEPPQEIHIQVDEYQWALNHTNTWLYSYTVEPHHNFVLHETDDTWVRIFNNPALFDRLFRLDHNIDSEWEPNEVIRTAYESTLSAGVEDVLQGCEQLLEEL